MTYLELINAVLREINEVEITTVSTRGIQTSVKDFINKAQRDIINSEVEWPFTVVNQSFTTTAGTAEYSEETNAKQWTMIVLLKRSQASERTLRYLSFEEYERFNETDTNPTGDARGLPVYVYTTPDSKIGRLLYLMFLHIR